MPDGWRSNGEDFGTNDPSSTLPVIFETAQFFSASCPRGHGWTRAPRAMEVGYRLRRSAVMSRPAPSNVCLVSPRPASGHSARLAHGPFRLGTVSTSAPSASSHDHRRSHYVRSSDDVRDRRFAKQDSGADGRIWVPASRVYRARAAG